MVPGKKHIITQVFPYLSILLWLMIFPCYWTRPDSFAALTLWPAWGWMILGIILSVPGWKLRSRKLIIIVTVLWFVFTVFHVEESRSLIRSVVTSESGWQETRDHSKSVRVVTLNCSGGSIAAADEVRKYKPDVVLLQESPGKEEVERLAHRLFGKNAGFVWGPDASIIARGKIRADELSPELSLLMSEANVTFASGMRLQVISLRLTPPVFRVDLWSPDCWREMNENRKLRREQVKLVMERIGRSDGDLPVVLGGDMNAPAGDGALRLFSTCLHDTFTEGGRGWGNTVLNDIPVLRFDQVWVSENLRAVSVKARRTVYSDHRLVVCDLIMH